MTSKNTFINKSNLTNLSALGVIVLSLFIQEPLGHELLANIGFFALSGALTNWIAVHMLFEKVPFLYGSGVIQNRFEELKGAIKNLIHEQFFTTEYISFLVDQQKHNMLQHTDKFADAIDYDALFEGLIEAVMSSSFGSMLQMVGGEKALSPIQDNFKSKMRDIISQHLSDPNLQDKLKNAIDNEELVGPLKANLEDVIDSRLDQMTPQMVKALMKNIMHHHLGWLVVWGGVFGGLLGLLKSLLLLW